ncbi:MAG TPA: HEPN domain-containing protein [Prolixibacteraceae bacterium]|nr:HEPN domain-containing protein [Prolixibacteraceae bacterium]HPR60516.1 HEPN domain-containing protein [Prolixibacteraceae bacterium]
MKEKTYIFAIMQDKIENIDKIVQHWIDASEKDFQTMQNLLRSGDYSWAMFLGHLVLEKLLKAHFVKNQKKHALFTHDLLRLATKAELIFNDEIEEWLDDISTFNINARYDNYKQDFYKLCTKDFAKLWSERIEIIRQWLIKEL